LKLKLEAVSLSNTEGMPFCIFTYPGIDMHHFYNYFDLVNHIIPAMVPLKHGTQLQTAVNLFFFFNLLAFVLSLFLCFLFYFVLNDFIRYPTELQCLIELPNA